MHELWSWTVEMWTLGLRVEPLMQMTEAFTRLLKILRPPLVRRPSVHANLFFVQ